jgi:CPA1 family monovalent cation:H+ antiporter
VATVGVALVAGRSAIPASVGLVLVGLGVSVVGPDVGVPVPPGLLLAIVLPGLVFEAAFRADREVLRPAVVPILVLAIPGVVIVAAIVALVLASTTALSPTEGFLVGAMVAATDPAAVLSTFRRVPVPRRLATMVEMESLVNDGTGIVLFVLAVDVLAGGGTVGGSVVAFVVRVAGGALAGAAFGWLGARLVRGLDDHLAELTVTVVLAYGTYLVAEAAGLSGVIATLVAAGTFGATARDGLTARAIEAIDVVWEFAAFLLTAGVFLLIGLSSAWRSFLPRARSAGGSPPCSRPGRSSCSGCSAAGRWSPGACRGDADDRLGQPTNCRRHGSSSSSGRVCVAQCPWRWPCPSRRPWSIGT